jgi:hypothetical protein
MVLKTGVGIAQPVKQRATGWMPRIRFPAGQDFSLLHAVQTDSGAHPSSYPIGSGALSPVIMRPGRKAEHSPPSSAQVTKGGAIPPLPHMSSWQRAELIKHRNNFMRLRPLN